MLVFFKKKHTTSGSSAISEEKNEGTDSPVPLELEPTALAVEEFLRLSLGASFQVIVLTPGTYKRQ